MTRFVAIGCTTRSLLRVHGPLNGFTQLRARLGHFNREHHLNVQNVALYWHFVDAVWIFIFASLYISPHVLKS